MKKVLIIDDDPGIAIVVEFRLHKMGHEVFIAVNGKEGLEKVMEIKPDLVILDFSMPLLNGSEVCKHIKTDVTTRHIPVILMTADIEQIQEEYPDQTGADEKILKPFESRELFDKVRKYIG